MITRHTFGDLAWVDIERPESADIVALVEEFDIDAACAEELLSPTTRPRIESYSNSIYLVLHFPDGIGRRKTIREEEIDFIIGKNFLITVRYDTSDAINSFAKAYDMNTVLAREIPNHTSGSLFYYIMRHLYRDVDEQLASINRDIRKLESDIYTGKDPRVVEHISNVSRQLLDCKQSLRFHETILQSFNEYAPHVFGEQIVKRSKGVFNEYIKLMNLLQGHRDVLHELRETSDSLLSTHNNEIMKNLTVMTFIMLPLTLITSVFGMNTDMTLINSPATFLFVLGAMTITGICMILYFKSRKWF